MDKLTFCLLDNRLKQETDVSKEHFKSSLILEIN